MLITINCYAVNDSITPVRKGEKVPDVYFKAITGNNWEESHLEAYKGKWILLDFWGVYCADCIAGLPKMVALQNQFKDKLQILVVTVDKQKVVEGLWKRFSGKPHAIEWVKAGNALPFVMGDTSLCKLFPHTGLPTHVWIDPDQVLRGISYSSTTNAENVQRLIENKPVYLQEQHDIQLNVDDPVSWVNPQYDVTSKLQFYSMLYRRIEIGHFTRIQQSLMDSLEGKVVGYSCLNNSITDLYNLAFKRWSDSIGSEVDGIANNRIIIEAQDIRRFIVPENENPLLWMDTNSYCYAIKVPVNKAAHLEVIIRNQLDDYFGLRSGIEQRRIKCFVLLGAGMLKNDSTVKKQRFAKIVNEQGRDYLVLQNAPVATLYSYLNNALSKLNYALPFFNEADYRGYLSMKIPWDFEVQDLPLDEIKKGLIQNGFELKEVYRNIDMLVLSDQK